MKVVSLPTGWKVAHQMAELQGKETGFVGFFDISGYGSFLESGITEVTFKVIEILANLSQSDGVLRKALLGHCGIGLSLVPDLEWELDRITPLVVSDSIILRSAYDETRDVLKKSSQAATFVMAASVFQRAMFEEGLPVRGAIAFGDFVFRENVFAGKPIIDAHKAGQTLNMAGCAIHETAQKEFESLLAVDSQYQSFLAFGKILVGYSTPVKNANGQTEEMRMLLNLSWPTLKDYPSLNGIDLRSYVHDKFLAHNKQLVSDAVTKAENTERFFRFLKNRFPNFFYR